MLSEDVVRGPDVHPVSSLLYEAAGGCSPNSNQSREALQPSNLPRRQATAAIAQDAGLRDRDESGDVGRALRAESGRTQVHHRLIKGSGVLRLPLELASRCREVAQVPPTLQPLLENVEVLGVKLGVLALKVGFPVRGAVLDEEVSLVDELVDPYREAGELVDARAPQIIDEVVGIDQVCSAAVGA